MRERVEGLLGKIRGEVDGVLAKIVGEGWGEDGSEVVVRALVEAVRLEEEGPVVGVEYVRRFPTPVA